MTDELIQPVMPRKWYEIWWDIYSHPGVTPFRTALNEPGHDITRGFIWVAVTAFIMTLVSLLFSTLAMRNLMSDAFRGELFKEYGAYTVSYICAVILAPLFACIGIAISAAIYHLVAKLFHGKGTWNNLVFCMSAVFAPGTLVGCVVGIFYLLFSQIPVLIFLPALVAMAFGVYTLVLNINAIRAAEDIGTGEAVATYFIPSIIAVVLVSCCSIVILIPLISQSISGQ
jgi:hypothetical protein